MAQLRIARQAADDIDETLYHSSQVHGAAAAARYRGLISLALQDLMTDPLRPDTSDRIEFGAGIRSYHLRHCKKRATRFTGRVAQPRHMLFYRTIGDDLVEIVRMLHDSMDFGRHVPTEPEEAT